MFSFRRPSDDDLTALVAQQALEPFTYRDVGGTGGARPPGYRHDRWRVDLGAYDAERFRLAAEGLRGWAIQRGAGLIVFPPTPVEVDATVALVIRLPVGFVTATARIVYVIDEPLRSGFAYGTLPGHPEEGEEAFTITRHHDRLCFEITAFSKPRHPLVRLGGPVSRLFQLRTTNGYIAAMRGVVA